MNPTLEAFFIGPTLFLAFLIYADFNKANAAANKWLASFIFCIFLIQIISPIEKLNFPFKTILADFLNVVSFIVAPVFYFTISYFVKPDRKWKFTDNLHFLFPFLILTLTILTFFIDKVSPSNSNEKDIENNAVIIFAVLFSVSVALYCIAAYRKISSYQKNTFQYTSNIQPVSLKWLQQVSICVLLLTIIWLLDIVFDLSGASLTYDVFSSLLTFSGIVYIAFHSLKQK
jgi:uncharacterized protein involved in response to NO